jgi:hypothetical protein
LPGAARAWLVSWRNANKAKLPDQFRQSVIRSSGGAFGEKAQIIQVKFMERKQKTQIS